MPELNARAVRERIKELSGSIPLDTNPNLLSRIHAATRKLEQAINLAIDKIEHQAERRDRALREAREADVVQKRAQAKTRRESKKHESEKELATADGPSESTVQITE